MELFTFATMFKRLTIMKYLAFIITAVALLLTNIYCRAQVEEADQTLIFQPFPTGMIETKSLPPATIEGTYYIEDSWQVGNILLKDDNTVKQTPLKYDLEHNTMEIYTKRGVKILYSDRIKQFSWTNTHGITQYFVNTDIFESNEDIPAGFFEIITEGPYTLVDKKDIKYIEPNYSEIHDAGNKNGRYVHADKFYYITGNKVFTIPKGKKSFLSIFGDKSAKIAAYMKENRFGHKDRYHLRKIFEYYNSLQTS